MFDRFGDDARQGLVFAHDEARALEHGYVGTEHLLLGAIEQSSGIAAGLESLGVSLPDLITKIEESTDPERRRSKGPRPYTPRAKRALDTSNDVAENLGDACVRPEHIVLALLEGEDVPVNLFAALGVQSDAVKATLLELLRSDPTPAGDGTDAEPAAALDAELAEEAEAEAEEEEDEGGGGGGGPAAEK